jgi:hypothetical protein
MFELIVEAHVVHLLEDVVQFGVDAHGETASAAEELWASTSLVIAHHTATLSKRLVAQDARSCRCSRGTRARARSGLTTFQRPAPGKERASWRPA